MAGIQLRVLKTGNCGENCVAGLDEAGRGSLVGELFVALTVFPQSVVEGSELAGVKDSKALEPLERRALIERILEKACYAAVALIPPSMIDEENLNRLEYRAMAYLLKDAASRGVRPARITIDLVGTIPRIKASLAWAGVRGNIVAEERADAKYPEVSAASIVAKVLRDERIRELAQQYGDMGSGYPSDPRALEWLRHQCLSGEPPPIVRRSWRTLDRVCPGKRVRKRRGQKTLADFMGQEGAVGAEPTNDY